MNSDRRQTKDIPKNSYQPTLRLLSLEQAALELSMSKRTFQRHLKDGTIKLRAVRLGGGRPKYKLKDLIALVEHAAEPPEMSGSESADKEDMEPRQLGIPLLTGRHCHMDQPINLSDLIPTEAIPANTGWSSTQTELSARLSRTIGDLASDADLFIQFALQVLVMRGDCRGLAFPTDAADKGTDTDQNLLCRFLKCEVCSRPWNNKK